MHRNPKIRVFLKARVNADEECVLCCLKLDLHESVPLDLVFTRYAMQFTPVRSIAVIRAYQYRHLRQKHDRLLLFWLLLIFYHLSAHCVRQVH